jgi:hypothetical protein
MPDMQKLMRLTVFLIVCFLLLPANTYAYLDLGTGSYVLQIVIATFLGFAFMLKSYLKKAFLFISGLFHKKNK